MGATRTSLIEELFDTPLPYQSPRDHEEQEKAEKEVVYTKNKGKLLKRPEWAEDIQKEAVSISQPYDINSLVGDHVRIWPYVSHLFHPDDLFKIWRMMQDDDVIDKIFWSQVPFKDSPSPGYGTFAVYMEKSLPLIVQDTEHDGGVVGLVWFDDIVTGHRASINVWYRRKSPHAARMEGTALVLRYGFEMHGWQHTYGVTPWKEAVRHGKALGFTVCGKSPQYALVRDVPHDLYMIHKSSEL